MTSRPTRQNSRGEAFGTQRPHPIKIRMPLAVENRRVVIRLIREWHAVIVISHRPNDYHPDHRYAEFEAAVVYYEERGVAWDNVSPQKFEPRSNVFSRRGKVADSGSRRSPLYDASVSLQCIVHDRTWFHSNSGNHARKASAWVLARPPCKQAEAILTAAAADLILY
jgi:LmbE family N-acetylglucosaminyl deacetylase